MSFSRTDEGCLATLSEVERAVLVNLASDLRDLLRDADADIDIDADTDADLRSRYDVLARLVPDAHPNDVEASDEFRRLTAPDLVASKIGQLRVVIRLFGSANAGDTIELTEADAQSLLRALTDLRLTLAGRIGIHTDEDAAAPLDPDDLTRNVYEWLGYLQATLIEALS